ncbi:MAG: hypothetical protein ACD_12C00637G0003 [uncultured bacterium]|nr:MAG: hypothetical protein ACD_12C00637G0003 [uncultured bacterium]
MKKLALILVITIAAIVIIPSCGSENSVPEIKFSVSTVFNENLSADQMIKNDKIYVFVSAASGVEDFEFYLIPGESRTFSGDSAKMFLGGIYGIMPAFTIESASDPLGKNYDYDWFIEDSRKETFKIKQNNSKKIRIFPSKVKKVEVKGVRVKRND